MQSIITEALTLVALVLRAVERVATQALFACDPYESRRIALPGTRLLKTLIFYQCTKDPPQAGRRRVVNEAAAAQQMLGGKVARKTLAKALQQRDRDQRSAAWRLFWAAARPLLARGGKKFARLAAGDASLLKLARAAFDWAH